MAKKAIWIFVALYFSSHQVLSNVFDHLLDDVEPCKEACDKTYPLHTYPNPKHSECCKRGCRFFSLVELINNQQNVNSTRDACMASCMEAYSQTADRYACNIGCSNQVPYAKPSVASVAASGSSAGTLTSTQEKPGNAQTLHLLTPFMYVHNIYNNMVDHMSRIMSVSWSFYLRQDDGKVVVLQSEPEIITEYMDMDDGEDNASLDSSDDSMTDDGGLPSLTHQSDQLGQMPRSPAMASDSMPDIYMYHARQKMGASGTGNEDQLPMRITVSAYTTEEIQSVDWLGCVSRKSGLPRWLLGLIIFFSAMVMVWLCFATTVTAPDHHIRPQILSIYGDLDSMKCSQEKVKIQPSYSPLIDMEDTEQAGPLPTKVSLEQA